MAISADGRARGARVYAGRVARSNRVFAAYLQFISDGAYTGLELWLSEGWDNVKRASWQAPLYRRRDAGDKTGWRVFTVAGWHGLSALVDTPVCHISCFEADALHVGGVAASDSGGAGIRRESDNGRGNLAETGRLHPAAARGAGLSNCFAIAGNGRASAYTGYPGYKPLPVRLANTWQVHVRLNDSPRGDRVSLLRVTFGRPIEISFHRQPDGSLPERGRR